MCKSATNPMMKIFACLFALTVVMNATAEADGDVTRDQSTGEEVRPATAAPDDTLSEETVIEEEPAVPEEGASMEEITVTGSRIKRDTFTSSSPITVITSERSALAGLLDTADILQGSTIASGQQIDDSWSGFVTDGGPGANTLSLRGLGPQRTLLLVNGRRWGPSGVRGSTNSVDLSAIPSSIISRIEILKDGASSIYGADAVAGVVNIITKTRQDGFQLNLATAVPEAGGSEEYSADAIWGRSGDDWQAYIAAAYSVQKDLRRSERGYSECDLRPRITDQDGDGTIDNRHPDTGEELCFGAPYGFVVSPFGWVRYDPRLGPDATPETPGFDLGLNLLYGIPYYTRGRETPLDNSGPYYRDIRSPDIYHIVAKSDRVSVTAFADKDLILFGSTARAWGEFFYNRRESEGSGGYPQFFPTVPASNPTNPFGLSSPLAPLARSGTRLTAQPVIMSYNLVDPTSYVDVERINTFTGLEGDFGASWSFDALLGYSYSNGTYEGNVWLKDRVEASLDAVLDADGKLVCRNPDKFPGCVSANLFTESSLLEGTLPADYMNYISKFTKGETTYETLQFSAYMTGTLFKIRDNEEAQLVLGVELRHEEIDDEPDIEAQNDNIWGRTTASITKGSDVVREAFAEFEMPLLAPNTRFADEMTLNLAARYTDYNSYGGDWTERAQFNWQINSLVRLRGTYGTSFRAPDLFEQHLGDQTGFQRGLLDPCVSYGRTNRTGDPIYVNCQNAGLEPTHGETGAPGIRAITGGNPDLLAETSDAWTAGVILTPEELGISIALSYYQIELDNQVASPSVAYILYQCYDSENLSHPLCSRIGPRDDAGFLTDVNSSLLNIGVQRTEGVDVDISYEQEFSRFDLTVDLTATYIDEQYLELLGEEIYMEGKWGFPHWSSRLDTTVNWRDWRFFYTVSHIGPSEEDPVFDPGTKNRDRINATDTEHYHSISARYTSPDKWQIIASVRNLFDRGPPIVSDGQGSNSANRIFNTLPGSGYLLRGRVFVLQFAKEF